MGYTNKITDKDYANLYFANKKYTQRQNLRMMNLYSTVIVLSVVLMATVIAGPNKRESNDVMSRRDLNDDLNKVADDASKYANSVINTSNTFLPSKPLIFLSVSVMILIFN